MNKKIMYFTTAFVIITISFCRLSVISHASYADEWLKKKQEQQQKYMQELADEGTLTEDNINSITKGKGTNIKPTKKTEKKETKENTQENRGYVYGVDELHITGLPIDERGYTKAGDYGKIE